MVRKIAYEEDFLYHKHTINYDIYNTYHKSFYRRSALCYSRLEGRGEKMVETKTEKVDLGKTGVVDMPRIDVTGYIGKPAEIDAVTEHKGVHGYFVKLTTKPLGSLKDETGKLVEDSTGKPMLATATRLFSLKEDKDGNIGWTDKSKLAEFLAKHDVKHYNELPGKKVLVQGRDQEGTTFLTIA